MTSAVLPLSSYQADFVTGKEALHAYIEILAVGLVGPVGNISKQSKCLEPILPRHFHGQVAVYKTDTFWSRGPMATTCKVPQMISLCWEVAGLIFLGEIFLLLTPETMTVPRNARLLEKLRATTKSSSASDSPESKNFRNERALQDRRTSVFVALRGEAQGLGTAKIQGTSFFQQRLVKKMDARRALHETFAESISIWPVSATGWAKFHRFSADGRTHTHNTGNSVRPAICFQSWGESSECAALLVEAWHTWLLDLEGAWKEVSTIQVFPLRKLEAVSLPPENPYTMRALCCIGPQCSIATIGSVGVWYIHMPPAALARRPMHFRRILASGSKKSGELKPGQNILSLWNGWPILTIFTRNISGWCSHFQRPFPLTTVRHVEVEAAAESLETKLGGDDWKLCCDVQSTCNSCGTQRRCMAK